jgi:TolA-binding protein
MEFEAVEMGEFLLESKKIGQFFEWSNWTKENWTEQNGQSNWGIEEGHWGETGGQRERWKLSWIWGFKDELDMLKETVNRLNGTVADLESQNQINEQVIASKNEDIKNYEEEMKVGRLGWIEHIS